MLALQLSKGSLSANLVKTSEPRINADQQCLEMKAAALNKRDDWICKGLYPGIVADCTLGSDGCAEDESGQQFILCPSINWGTRKAVQSKSYSILGMPTQGTFAERIGVSTKLMYKKPQHLDVIEAAALPLAGLTAWRALINQGGCLATDRVLISGIGGGVALYAMQFAINMGCETWVSSSSNPKIERAKKMGAAGGLRYDLDDKTPGLFDLIIDGAGGCGFGKLINALAPGGRLVFYGGTKGKWPDISPQRLFFKQAKLIGSTMGSPTEFSEMLSFVETHQIHPVVDSIFDLKNVGKAFERLCSKDRFGKVVLSI